ncbi:hypothetical protein W97_05560 [Coniosporium apollinis CBS 100218]|uniref:C2H2-type domain-containing protein n=1 Tax=Coniosporium apollinis (strain CBS 100218) TaxID=1168221 RepID=R7YX32_CONA1|nr:uncharacterized protein W97_05560 [Coniosporium apollinis CBS 100218]EON66462.1 hypothetical protein W97_05560 [Coniosporium apollinis CBS 100218]
MVNGSGREGPRETHDHHYQRHHPYAHIRTRAHQPQPQAASALVPNPYSGQPPVDFTTYHRPSAPRSPPSPPVEEQKPPSLPSISSLLSFDGTRPSQETATQAVPPPQKAAAAAVPLSEHRPNQVPQAPQAFGPPTIVSNPAMNLPPTPPMAPESVIDGNQSPSTVSSQSSATAAPYYLGSMNNMDPHQQRVVPSVAPMKRHSATSHPSVSPYHTSPYHTSPYQPSPYHTSPCANSPYGSSPGGASTGTGSYYSPDGFSQPGMYSQRPLPSNFPPPSAPVAVPASASPASNPWQHHHYISHSSQAAFPQSQDRYICQTCNKAFSRPSSLRIHSHSHTGEKPFKCPHSGCGKAFSVRSNMKRHERGCHAAGNAAMSAPA